MRVLLCECECVCVCALCEYVCVRVCVLLLERLGLLPRHETVVQTLLIFPHRLCLITPGFCASLASSFAQSEACRGPDPDVSGVTIVGVHVQSGRQSIFVKRKTLLTGVALWYKLLHEGREMAMHGRDDI